MSSASTSELTRVIAPSRSLRQHALQIWEYRELLGNLVRKELKVKYKGSSLGFLWSLLNPLMTLVVFYVAFQLVIGAGIPSFAIFLLTGLLAWNFFSVSAGGSVNAIVANASLVNKVYFPREILPLAAVGSNLVHFLLQALVLGATIIGVEVFKLVTRPDAARLADLPRVDLEFLWLIIPALVTLLILSAAFAIFLSCVNVYARDTQHLLELSILAWFWMTPIIYPWGFQARSLQEAGIPSGVALINPMTSVVLAFQRALYGIVERVIPPNPADIRGIPAVEVQLPLDGPLWYFRNLAIVAVVGLILLALAVKLFDRLEGNFAEEL